MNLTVRVESEFPAVVPDAVSFETGASRAQAADPDLYVYEHHGDQFGWADPGALTIFFEDLMLARPLPVTLATKKINDVDTLVAITLFLHRELVLLPAALQLVGAADLVHRRGVPALAHVDPDLSLFFRKLRIHFPKTLGKREFSDHLTTATGWIRDYLANGEIPQFMTHDDDVNVIDVGSDGFVAASTTASLLDGWVELYRRGFTRGLLVGPPRNDRRPVLIARKGPYVPLRLEMAAHILNQAELAMGEPNGWKTDGLWLEGPEDGTLILVSDLLRVLVRV